jgi:hypothetical protein
LQWPTVFLGGEREKREEEKNFLPVLLCILLANMHLPTVTGGEAHRMPPWMVAFGVVWELYAPPKAQEAF